MEQNNLRRQKTTITSFLSILVRWKKFLLINIILILAIAVGISLLIPDQFKSTATVMVTSDNTGGLGGLSGLISGGPITSMGAQLLGVGGGSTEIIFGILNSRSALVNAINKFDLMAYYEIEDKNMDKALKAFKGDVIFETNENGINLVDISVINKDPVLSAEIANYFVHLVDSINIKLNVEQAKNNKEFIEKRYRKNVADLNKAEDSLHHFQKKFGVIAVPEQLEIIYQAAAEIEAGLVESEIAASLVKNQFGENSPQYELARQRLQAFRDKVVELKDSKTIASESNIFIPFKEFPEISFKYMKIYREVELQGKIMEFLLPMYEQAVVEEQKSIPTVAVVDKAVPAELKDSPKRSAIVIGIGILFFFIFSVMVYRGEQAYQRTQFENDIEEKESKFFQRIIRIYRLKF